jgi:tetratricopeptide (TPR) repeat protein
MGAIHLFQREHNKALEEGTKSISLGPSNAENHALLAMTMVHSAIFEDAVNHSQMAMRLSPYYPAWYLAPNGAAKYFLRRYEEATEAFKLCLERSLKDRGAILIYAYIYLAAIYAETGQIDEAHNQIEEAQKIYSNLSLEWVEKTTFQRDHMQLQRWLEALRKAGLK